MFGAVGWGEIFVLLVVGLVVLGPERLPGAIKSTTQAIRKAKDFITDTTDKIRDEYGDDFDSIMEPIEEVKKLRSMSPSRFFSDHILQENRSAISTDRYGSSELEDTYEVSHFGYSGYNYEPLKEGERAPFDAEAT